MKKLLFWGVIFMTSSAVGLSLSSLDFKNNGKISKEFSCGEDGNDGANIIPKLVWSGVPAKTKSFALICDDPDAPGGAKNPWVHWVVYNIPANKMSSDYITDKRAKFPDGTLQGKNSWPRLGYDGPCPPPGKPHRYHFKLYALDALLPLEPGATKAELLKAMNGHIIGQTEIVGLYGR
jgi:Raf kinase inhibitor-like YbhB/YbcL family protein